MRDGEPKSEKFRNYTTQVAGTEIKAEITPENTDKNSILGHSARFLFIVT
jgi:hypothetical protein